MSYQITGDVTEWKVTVHVCGFLDLLTTVCNKRKDIPGRSDSSQTRFLTCIVYSTDRPVETASLPECVIDVDRFYYEYTLNS